MTDAPPAKESLTMRLVVSVLVTVIMVLPFVLLGAGGWLLWQRQFGEKVEAEVISCELDVNYKTSSQQCLARWTEDGIERTGPIQGSGDQEVGETITATRRGDELYSRSLTLPLVLIGLALPLCILPVLWLRNRLTRSRAGEGDR